MTSDFRNAVIFFLKAIHKTQPSAHGFGRQEKWHIDLWEANRMQLLDFGVLPSNIELSGICTWKENADFFSARRQGIASGRILSGIMLKSV
jgi:copper oxidase (laccase) domain-containing protein